MGRRAGIEVENLVREFRKGPRAVDGISLTVEPGEIYGFLGPNGAGKSTTVLMLTTLLPPTSGTARVAGYDVVKEGPQVRASISSSPDATTCTCRARCTVSHASSVARGERSSSGASGSPRPPTGRCGGTPAG